MMNMEVPAPGGGSTALSRAAIPSTSSSARAMANLGQVPSTSAAAAVNIHNVTVQVPNPDLSDPVERINKIIQNRGKVFSPEELDKIEKEVKEHIANSLERKPVHYLTKTPELRNLELSYQETILNMDTSCKRDIRELRNSVNTMLLAYSKEFLNVKVCDLIQELENKPQTYKEFMDALAEEGQKYEDRDKGPAGKFNHRLSDVYEEMEDSFQTALDESSPNKVVPATPEGNENTGQYKTPPNQSQSEGESGDENEVGSAEILMATPPGKPVDRRLRPTAKAKKALIPKVKSSKKPESRKPDAEFPTGKEQVQVHSKATPREVFVFKGNGDKPRRPVEDGEIVYSRTGSPIAVPSGPSTPVSSSGTDLSSGRPITLAVDGGKFSIDIIYRGKMEELPRFREFVTDMRGYIVTRTLQQNRIQPPRVPNVQTSASCQQPTRVNRPRIAKQKAAEQPKWKNN